MLGSPGPGGEPGELLPSPQEGPELRGAYCWKAVPAFLASFLDPELACLPSTSACSCAALLGLLLLPGDAAVRGVGEQ